MHQNNKGFSVIELFITLAVVIVLGFLTYPFYANYKHRLYYAELNQAAVTYKTAVGECQVALKTFKGCDGGKHHIPANITKPKGHIASLTVKDGVINLVPVQAEGILTADSLTYTPNMLNNALVWEASGEAVKKHYAP